MTSPLPFLMETRLESEERGLHTPLSISMETQLESGERGGGEWKTIPMETQLESGARRRREEEWKALHKPLAIPMETQLESGGRVGEEWKVPLSIFMESQLESGRRRGEEWKALHTPLSVLMETQLEPGERGGGEERSILHKALKQEYACLSWGERYKIALEVATSLAFLHPHETFIHAHGDFKSSDIFFGSLQGTAKWECVEGFGKFLYALISGKESGAAKVPSCIVGGRRRLGRAEYAAFKAVLWLRRHTIPPLPLACPLRRYYILNGDDLDKRTRNEVVASGRAIVQLGAALGVVVQCTQVDPGSRPTMAEVYATLAAAHSSYIPFSLTAALKIGFPLYRSLALLIYLVVFFYVGIYKSLGLIVYYVPYAFGAYGSPANAYSYDPLDALLLLFSLLALFSFVLRTVCTLNGLDDVLYLH